MEPSGAPWRVIEPEEPETTAPPAPSGLARDLPWVAIGAALIAIVVGCSLFLLATRPDPAIVVDGATSAEAGSVAEGGTSAADPASPAAPLVVEVGGAVVHPGVYRLPPGARVMDAVTAAGGFGPRVDAALADARLNLAAALHDGDEIHVPARGEAASGGATASGAAPAAAGGSGGLVDLNHATEDQLDALPGVGPATVAKIVAAREESPFASVDDLGTRKVVGPATLAKLRPLVTVTP